MTRRHRHQRILNRLAARHFTARELATVCGVSMRTIYRDIRLLREDGYTVRGAPGPGGGHWLGADSRSAPLNLQGGQTRELALQLAMAGQGGSPLFEQIVATLPPRRRRMLRALLRNTTPPPSAALPPKLDCIERAMTNGWLLHVRHSKPLLPRHVRRQKDEWVLIGLDRQHHYRQTPLSKLTGARALAPKFHPYGPLFDPPSDRDRTHLWLDAPSRPADLFDSNDHPLGPDPS